MHLKSGSLFELLALPVGSKVSVIGCGGKSSAVDCVAGAAAKIQSVLIAPTTAIYAPKDGNPCMDSENIFRHIPKLGVQYAGKRDGKKLRALPVDVLKSASEAYDLILMEADGSRGKPLKGWEKYEPVVPDFTTHTLGVALVPVIGEKLGEENVHRYELFSELSGLSYGDTVTAHALCEMITGKNGMLDNARGKKTVLLNGVKKQNDETAKRLAELISGRMPEVRIISGDTYSDIWYEME